MKTLAKYSPAAEPVRWMAAATDVVIAVSYFAHIAPEGTAILTGAVVSLLAIFTRNAVTPTG